MEPWLSVEDISKHLGVSKETIYRWLEREKIPSHRIGKFWKFRASEVDQWVYEGSASNEPDKKNSRTKVNEVSDKSSGRI